MMAAPVQQSSLKETDIDLSNVKIKQFPRLGRGLAASRDIEAGESVLNISDPFLILVEKHSLGKVCSFCFIEAEQDLKRCSSCKVTCYCSLVCQKSDWASSHKKECPVLKGLPGIPPTPVRGLMQVLLRYDLGKGPESVWALDGHVESLRQTKRWNELIVQAKGAVEYSKRSKVPVETAINILCRVCMLS